MDIIFNFHFKCFTKTLIFLLPCFLCVYSQTSLLPPLPLIPDLLSFLDIRLALIYPIIQTFKDTITSDPLGITSTWVGSDVCNYTGFYCDHPPDNESAIALASIDLNGFRLEAPTLDGFLDRLPDLALFHANTNQFAGSLPEKLSKLPFLYELDVSNNKLSGSFPQEILQMSSLSFLDLRYNFFSGPVPPGIFLLKLEILFLNNNNFWGNLPDSLGSTPARYLTLANNKFTGPIPRTIGSAASTLQEVLFLNNLLSGCLPYELGFLKEATVIDASHNLLTGPLPLSLGCLRKIEQLNFAGNLLYGEVPEVLCTVGNLLNLSLSNNYFTKVGPSCKKLINSGILDVTSNCIADLPNQRSAKECAAFTSRPRNCSRPETFKAIPCNVTPVSNPQTRGKKNSVAYGALVRHRVP
ncbi:uncharacterized protein At4g06744-like [Mangifera indica]|uniref:uncharacterized protein At4g06744-like n=1 Tax=Mangifera indica TaxID=29780 RepID=UPI001CFC44BC|nr:uncharacterized protein At4g06744-like [Mangifera indica]